MKLSLLLKVLSVKPLHRLPTLEITKITQSSTDASSGSVFVCIRGFRADGHSYARDAYDNGCRVFVAERPPELPQDAVVVTVPDTKQALGLLACAFYGHPSRRLKLIGITGTKGKTTTATLLAEILEKSGISCGYIGTNGASFCGHHKPLLNTTPDALTLQHILAEMADAGCRAVVLEVSSQALGQHRVNGVHFAATLFTNLYTDHIGPGEHEDLADYISCKHRLFTDFPAALTVYNTDDLHAAEITGGGLAKKRYSCAIDQVADYRATELQAIRADGDFVTAFTLISNKQVVTCRLPLIGKGNVYNAMMAMACAQELFGISLQNAAKVLQNAKVDGRSEIIALSKDRTAVIDYAHNGASLRGLLGDLRAYVEHGRLICLFGSVGGRTELRRVELGRAAAELADLAILTSDNPGKESPEQIIADIAEGFTGTNTPYRSIPDRTEAIRYALRIMQAGDLLVLAGKGHESYQLIGSEMLPFSERAILESEDELIRQ